MGQQGMGTQGNPPATQGGGAFQGGGGSQGFDRTPHHGHKTSVKPATPCEPIFPGSPWLTCQ